MLRIRPTAAAAAAVPVLAAGLLTAAPASAAGTCTLGVDYSFENGGASFRVTAYVDHCSGGGVMKFQAKYKTQIGTYFYGPWVSGVGASSQANSDVPAVLAGYKYNENNPVAVTCWVPGDSRTGSC